MAGAHAEEDTGSAAGSNSSDTYGGDVSEDNNDIFHIDRDPFVPVATLASSGEEDVAAIGAAAMSADPTLLDPPQALSPPPSFDHGADLTSLKSPPQPQGEVEVFASSVAYPPIDEPAATTTTPLPLPSSPSTVESTHVPIHASMEGMVASGESDDLGPQRLVRVASAATRLSNSPPSVVGWPGAITKLATVPTTKLPSVSVAFCLNVVAETGPYGQIFLPDNDAFVGVDTQRINNDFISPMNLSTVLAVNRAFKARFSYTTSGMVLTCSMKCFTLPSKASATDWVFQVAEYFPFDPGSNYSSRILVDGHASHQNVLWTYGNFMSGHGRWLWDPGTHSFHQSVIDKLRPMPWPSFCCSPFKVLAAHYMNSLLEGCQLAVNGATHDYQVPANAFSEVMDSFDVLFPCSISFLWGRISGWCGFSGQKYWYYEWTIQLQQISLNIIGNGIKAQMDMLSIHWKMTLGMILWILFCLGGSNAVVKAFGQEHPVRILVAKGK